MCVAAGMAQERRSPAARVARAVCEPEAQAAVLKFRLVRGALRPRVLRELIEARRTGQQNVYRPVPPSTAGRKHRRAIGNSAGIMRRLPAHRCRERVTELKFPILGRHVQRRPANRSGHGHALESRTAWDPESLT